MAISTEIDPIAAGALLLTILNIARGSHRRKKTAELAEKKASIIVESSIAQLRKDLNGHLQHTEPKLKEHEKLMLDMAVTKETVATIKDGQERIIRELQGTNAQLTNLGNTLLAFMAGKNHAKG